VPGSTSSATITAEGTTKLSYFAVDNGGNSEAPKTLTRAGIAAVTERILIVDMLFLLHLVRFHKNLRAESDSVYH
jgi:hypothetical protein